MRVHLALVSIVSVAAMSSAAMAQPDRVAVEVRLPETSVDFSDPASTARFYAMLQRGAAKACESGMGRNLTVAAEDRRCAAKALDRTVSTLGVTQLAALHEARTGRPALVTVFAAVD